MVTRTARPARTVATAVGVCAAALAGSLLVPAVAGADVTGAVPVIAPRADTVCPDLFGYTDDSLRPKSAAAIMAGQVDMGDYGRFTIPVDTRTGTLVPAWRTYSTLDLAGNRYVDSLEWTLPLLRVGLDRQVSTPGDPEGVAMVAQFVTLLRSWVASQPAPARRGVWVNHPQYGGFRLAVLACAVREIADPVTNAWLVAQTRAELAVQLAKATLSGANNTMLNAQLAAYAAARTVGTAAQQAKARAYVLALTASLTHADGSDEEGAPGYGLYLATIEARAARVMDAYGQTSDAAWVRARLARSAAFVTAASRPDRYLETIGDTAYRRILTTLYPASSGATWVATSGASGSRPTSLYSRWAGGYVFAHSAWLAGTDDESTFYSLRTGSSTPDAAHRHSDTTGVTYYSRGVSWVADPGPYRYDTSALRAYLRGRSAHSALVVSGGASFVAPATVLTARSAGGVDTTCVSDPAYLRGPGVQVMRCVYYLRALDALVVQDVVRPTRATAAVRQQYVLPPEVSSAKVAGPRVALVGTTAGGTRRDAVIASTRAAVVKGATATRAVLGREYGVREAGRVVQVAWSAPVGLSSSTVTVVAHGQVAAVSVSPSGRTLRVTASGRTQEISAGYVRFPRPRATVAIHAPGTVKRGKAFRLKGRVTAAGRRLPGVVVTVQRLGTHGWTSLGRVRADGHGRFATVFRARQRGVLSLRVTVEGMHGAAGWKRSASRVERVVVAKRH